MPTAPGPPVISVGIDENWASARALEWSAAWAERSGWGIRLVIGVDATHLSPRARARHLHDARAGLLRRIAKLRDSFPELPITARVCSGSSAAALVKASLSSDVVALGLSGQPDASTPEGRGSWDAADVCAHAHCAVVVFPSESSRAAFTGPVLVGIDGSPESAEAAEFALARAADSGVHVVAIAAHEVWAPPQATAAEIDAERRHLRQQAELALREVVEPLQAEWPRVPILPMVWAGKASDLLAQSSADASLVVVGHRGLGGFAGMLLGSTSRDLVSRAACPIAVVRAPTPA